tara:strand:- start:20598 stop:20867 length:270 start_codon:yes stop_codon:yes gene_type:complete
MILPSLVLSFAEVLLFKSKMESFQMTSKKTQSHKPSLDDINFEKLLDQMDELGRQADALREKVNHLIDEMQENDIIVDENSNSTQENAD